MELFNGLGFELMTESDVESLTPIMKRAFDEDTKRHLGKDSGGPPGYDNGDFIQKWYFKGKTKPHKVTKDGALIGAICVWIYEGGENYLGNMFVDPLCQDKGLGVIIWNYIEQKYPETKRWRTDTPGFSRRNHNFYVNKCGFKIIKIENPKDEIEEISYILEKEVSK